MAGSLLLDTNIVFALFAGEPVVLDRLKSAEGLFVPAIVIGELFYGACRSGQSAENLKRIELFSEQTTILSCDRGTARQYGELKDLQRKKGRPLPENDLWIAAMALQHHLILVSRDTHFQEVDGLQVALW